MFFYEVEGHMQNLSSFGRGKKIWPKKSLTRLLHKALQLDRTLHYMYCNRTVTVALEWVPFLIIKTNLTVILIIIFTKKLK